MSARLFGAIRQQSLQPSTQIILDAALRHHEIYGDAGLLVVALATRCARFPAGDGSVPDLICETCPADSLVETCAALSVSRHTAIIGNAHALDQVQTALDDLRCPCKIRLDWSDMRAVLSLVRGVVSPKRLAVLDSSGRTTEYLCVLIAEVAHIASSCDFIG